MPLKAKRTTTADSTTTTNTDSHHSSSSNSNSSSSNGGRISQLVQQQGRPRAAGLLAPAAAPAMPIFETNKIVLVKLDGHFWPAQVLPPNAHSNKSSSPPIAVCRMIDSAPKAPQPVFITNAADIKPFHEDLIGTLRASFIQAMPHNKTEHIRYSTSLSLAKDRLQQGLLAQTFDGQNDDADFQPSRTPTRQRNGQIPASTSPLAGKSPKATNSAPVRSKAPGTSNQPEPAKASQARSSSGSSFPSTSESSLDPKPQRKTASLAQFTHLGVALDNDTSAEEQRALRSRPPLVLSKSMFDTPVQASKSKAKIEVIDTPTTLEPDQSKPKVAAIDFAQSPRTSQASGRSTVHRDVIEPNSLEEEDKPAVRQLRQRTIASPNAKSPASPNPRAKSASSPTLAISKRRASEMDAEGPGPSLRVSAADVTDVVSSQEEPRSRRALASSQSPGDDSQGSRQRGLFNSAADGTEIRKLRQRVASPETKSSHAKVASNRGAGGASKRYTSESDADAANISARASVANVASSSQEDSSFNSAKVNKPGRQSQAQVSLSRNGELPVVPDDSAESPSGKRSTRANPGPVAAPQPSSTAGKKQHQTSKPTQQPKLDTFFSSAAAKPLPTSVKGRTASKEHTDAANNPDKSPKTKLEVFDFDEQPSRATHAHRPTNTSIPRPSVVRSIAADFLEPDSTPAAVAAASASVLRSIALSAQETVSTTAAAAAAAAAAGPSDKALPPARKVLRLDPHVEPSSSPPSSSGDSAAFETRLRSGVVRQQFDDEDEDGDLPSSSGPVDDDSDDELPAVQLSHQSTTDFRPGTVVWAKRRLDLMLNRFIWWPAKYISRLKAQKLHECNLFTGNLSLTDKPLEKRAKFISVKPYKCTDPDDPDTPAAYREALARARKAAEKLAVGTASIDQSSPMKQRFFAKAASDDEDDPMDTDQQAEELSDDDDNNGNTVQPSAADARDSSDEEQDAILAISARYTGNIKTFAKDILPHICKVADGGFSYWRDEYAKGDDSRPPASGPVPDSVVLKLLSHFEGDRKLMSRPPCRDHRFLTHVIVPEAVLQLISQRDGISEEAAFQKMKRPLSQEEAHALFQVTERQILRGPTAMAVE